MDWGNFQAQKNRVLEILRSIEFSNSGREPGNVIWCIKLFVAVYILRNAVVDFDNHQDVLGTPFPSWISPEHSFENGQFNDQELKYLARWVREFLEHGSFSEEHLKAGILESIENKLTWSNDYLKRVG
jgi:hypothetical protein